MRAFIGSELLPRTMMLVDVVRDPSDDRKVFEVVRDALNSAFFSHNNDDELLFSCRLHHNNMLLIVFHLQRQWNAFFDTGVSSLKLYGLDYTIYQAEGDSAKHFVELDVAQRFLNDVDAEPQVHQLVFKTVRENTLVLEDIPATSFIVYPDTREMAAFITIFLNNEVLNRKPTSKNKTHAFRVFVHRKQRACVIACKTREVYDAIVKNKELIQHLGRVNPSPHYLTGNIMTTALYMTAQEMLGISPPPKKTKEN